MSKRQIPLEQVKFDPDTETLDGIWRGKVYLIQPKKGYRYSIDAPLLADFVKTRRPAKVLDLGCGCGIIGLMLLTSGKASHATGVEVQEPLANLARRNGDINGLGDVFDVLQRDLRELDASNHNSFDLIVSNPPFFKEGCGFPNPDKSVAIARHELLCNVDDINCIARKCLRDGGRVALIYPAERSADVLASFVRNRLTPTRLRFVHSRDGEKAVLVLAEARKGKGKPLTVEGPFVLYGSDGKYTARAKAVWESED